MAKKEEKTTKTDFRKINNEDTVKAKFPTEVFNEYRVYFTVEAYDKMKEHANQTSEVELGGVLIGEICRDEQGKFLKISGIISGEHANNYGAQVTFTHETWQHINEIKDQKFPDLRIVGWYHTHPGFGVFLSEMDKFIQDNFFNQPFQVAVVLETKEEVEGCFIWQDGDSVPIQRYWVGDKEISLFSGKAHPFKMHSSPEKSHAGKDEVDKSETSPLMSQIFVLIMMGLLFFIGFLLGQFKMFNELKRSVYDGIQSEIYSIMEFASLNTTASQDLQLIEDELENLKQQAAQKEQVETGIDRITKDIQNLRRTYDKKRTRYRKDLLEIQNAKANLSQKVHQNRLASEDLKSQLALIAFMRLKNILDKTEGDYAKLSYEDKGFAQYCLNVALTNDPSTKLLITQEYPNLIKQMMPQSQSGNTDYNPKAGSLQK